MPFDRTSPKPVGEAFVARHGRDGTLRTLAGETGGKPPWMNEA
ncbi:MULTISPECIES: hypothetical protein [unclassified Sphingobium]